MINEMIVTISKGQQVTIPFEIRDSMGLLVGSKMEIEQKDNKIILKPLGDDLDKMFREAKKIKPKHGFSAKEMDELNEKLFR